MLFSRDEDLEDRIVRRIAGGKSSVKNLHAHLVQDGKSLSLRAVYKAVDKLMAAGTLIKAGKGLVIDAEWAGRVSEGLRSSTLPPLGAGERAVYTFSSMANLDAFWKTVVLPIENSTEASELFFYNPHNFWAYLPERRESEEAYYRHFGGEKYGFLVVGGEATADREFKQTYQSENFQVDTRNIGHFKRNEHITVVGSFVITVRLSARLARQIDLLYASGMKNEHMLPKLLLACRNPGKLRFSIENNATKAHTLTQALAKNFYFRRRGGVL